MQNKIALVTGGALGYKNGGPSIGSAIAFKLAREKDEVDKIMELAEKAGAKIVKKPQRVFWGGYSGYFADPDGYYWEVAYWEKWQFNEDGSLVIE